MTDADDELERLAQQAHQQKPPRKQIVYPAGPAEVAVLEGTEAGVPPGVKMLAFRFDAPWEAVLVPLTADAADTLGKQLSAASVIVPADASSITAGAGDPTPGFPARSAR
jgi:hypothetical protein